MKILITGSNGYIGSVFRNEAKNHHLIVADIVGGYPRNCLNIEEMYGVFAEGIDAVVHLAGVVGAPACRKYPVANELDNYTALNTIISLANRFNVKKFVYPSSCSVYGNVEGVYDEVDESTPVLPLTEYAHMKVETEKMLMEELNTPPIILRLTTVYGYAPIFRTDLVGNMFILSGMKKEPIRLEGGEQIRSMINVKDVATAILRAVEAPNFFGAYSPFIVGNKDGNISLEDFAKLVQEHTGTTINKVGEGSDRRSYNINPTKFMNAFDWEPMFSTESGIIYTIKKLTDFPPVCKSVIENYSMRF